MEEFFMKYPNLGHLQKEFQGKSSFTIMYTRGLNSVNLFE